MIRGLLLAFVAVWNSWGIHLQEQDFGIFRAESRIEFSVFIDRSEELKRRMIPVTKHVTVLQYPLNLITMDAIENRPILRVQGVRKSILNFGLPAIRNEQPERLLSVFGDNTNFWVFCWRTLILQLNWRESVPSVGKYLKCGPSTYICCRSFSSFLAVIRTEIFAFPGSRIFCPSLSFPLGKEISAS